MKVRFTPPPLAIVASVVLAAACNRGEGHETPSASSATASAITNAPIPAPSVTAPHWYEGTWKGTFQVQRHQIALDPKLGGLKEWRDDDGKAGTGTVNMTVTITPDGVARGEATGALGSLHGAGAIEDDRLTMQWSPAAADDFSGVLSVARSGDRLTGTMQSSTGNSLSVRGAPVTLEK